MREGGQEEAHMGRGQEEAGMREGLRRSGHGKEGQEKADMGEEGQEEADMGVLRRSGYRGRPEYRHYNKCK